MVEEEELVGEPEVGPAPGPSTEPSTGPSTGTEETPTHMPATAGGGTGKVTEPTTEPTTEPGVEWHCKRHGKVDNPEQRGKAMVCPTCKSFLRKVIPPPPEELAKASEVEGPKPLEQRVLDESVEFLQERLHRVYGISREGAETAIDRIRERPEVLFDPNYLYWHIKQYAGKNLNEYDLKWLLSSLHTRITNAYRQGPPPMDIPLTPLTQQQNQPISPFPVRQPYVSPQNPYTNNPLQIPQPFVPQQSMGLQPFIPSDIPRVRNDAHRTLTREELLNIMDERDRLREERDRQRERERKLDAAINILRSHESELEHIKSESSTKKESGGGSRPIILQPAGKTPDKDDPAQKFFKMVMDNAVEEFQKRSKDEGGMVIKSPDDLRNLLKEVVPKAPPGSIGPYDAEVRKAELERDARIAEAQARKDAWAVLGREIRGGFNDLGLGVGRGIAGIPTGPPTAPPSYAPAQPIRTVGTPVTDDKGVQTDLLQIPCPNPECDATIYYQRGRSRAKCPKCEQEYIIAPEA